MTELVKHSTERSIDAAAYAVSLLHHYGFDLGGYTIAQLLTVWQERYSAAWIRLATIEALYQGRYKAISVEQILALWQRRSQPLYHFNHEFERLVCDNLPASLVPLAPTPSTGTGLESRLPYHRTALHLPSFEGAALPESDVMLALRTLHSEEMAALADSQKQDETDKPASLQTYSYKLRSNEPSSSQQSPSQQSLSQQSPSKQTLPSDAAAQNPVDPPVALPDSESSLAEAIDTAVQTEATRSEHEPRKTEQHEPITLTADGSDQERSTATEPAMDDAATLTLSASEMPAPTAQTGSIARILRQLDHQALHTSVMLPGVGLLARTLKPNLQLHLTARYQPIWLTETVSKQPIHQFTPDPEPSDFHSKLKAVAQPTEALDADALNHPEA